MEQPGSALDNRIAELERKLEALKGVREALGDDELKREVLQLLTGGQPVGTGASSTRTPRQKPLVVRPQKPGQTIAERVIEHLRQDNKPITIGECATMLGCKESSVRQVFYKTHRNQFIKRPAPDGRRMEFLLKEGDDAAE